MVIVFVIFSFGDDFLQTQKKKKFPQKGHSFGTIDVFENFSLASNSPKAKRKRRISQIQHKQFAYTQRASTIRSNKIETRIEKKKRPRVKSRT